MNIKNKYNAFLAEYGFIDELKNIQNTENSEENISKQKHD